MSVYNWRNCEICGEEPDIVIELCPDCGKYLCERCWGDKTQEICQRCSGFTPPKYDAVYWEGMKILDEDKP